MGLEVRQLSKQTLESIFMRCLETGGIPPKQTGWVPGGADCCESCFGEFSVVSLQESAKGYGMRDLHREAGHRTGERTQQDAAQSREFPSLLQKGGSMENGTSHSCRYKRPPEHGAPRERKLTASSKGYVGMGINAMDTGHY